MTTHTPRSATGADVDPSAHVDETASIAPGARVLAQAWIGPGCVVGPGCVLHPRAMLVANTVLGQGNIVHPYAVLGGDPQVRSFDPASGAGRVEIGDDNVFREHATVNRSTDASPATRLGDRNYFMVQAHAGHDVQMGNDNTLGNGAAMGGHAEIGDRCVFGGYAVVHQFCMIGDGVMLRGVSGVAQHVPPYVLAAGQNHLAGLNSVGMKRNPDLTDEDRAHVREVYREVFRKRVGAPMAETIAELRDRGWAPAAQRFIEFIDHALHHPDVQRRSGVIGSRRSVRA